MEEQKTVLSVEHLSITFTQYEGGLRQTELPVITDLSLSVKAGEMVAVVGSSGSGKSLLAHAILGILPYNARVGGTMIYEGEPLTKKRQTLLRGKDIVLVPQSVAYLDPLMKIGAQVRQGRSGAADKEKSKKALERYGLGAETEDLYPFELSGGMSRRVLISTAMMAQPKLVIADEPTPGLHIDAARRVLSHFREIADDGSGVLLITHDLELALAVADRIVVFYAGTTVEDASAMDFEAEKRLRHPYTKALFRAMPQHGFEVHTGIQPYVKEMPDGCPYGPRCPKADETCKQEINNRSLRGGSVRCCKAE